MQADPDYDSVKFQRELILKLAGNPEVIKRYNKESADQMADSIAFLAEEIASRYEINTKMYG